MPEPGRGAAGSRGAGGPGRFVPLALALGLAVTPWLPEAPAAARAGEARASGTRTPGESGGGGSMRGLFLGSGPRGPITIDARRFEADNRRRTVTYTDQVVARQDDTTLTASRLVVSYDEARRISQVAAEGGVRIVQKGAPGAGPGGAPGPEREALCSRVIFQVADDRILCTGEPATLRQGEDVIRGPKITVQVAEERIIVEGDRNLPRVTSRITPPPREDRNTGAAGSALSQ